MSQTFKEISDIIVFSEKLISEIEKAKADGKLELSEVLVSLKNSVPEAIDAVSGCWNIKLNELSVEEKKELLSKLVSVAGKLIGLVIPLSADQKAELLGEDTFLGKLLPIIMKLIELLLPLIVK